MPLILASRMASADAVPAKNQALLLLRILAYDHNLSSRSDKTVTIVVVYKAGSSDSEDAANELYAIVSDVAKTATVGNKSIQVVRLAYTDKTFDAEAGKLKASAIYVSPGLGDNLATITSTTHGRKMLSFTGNEDYVGSGLAIGFALQDNKPMILVNIPASHSEGADLDAALLRVAKIIKK